MVLNGTKMYLWVRKGHDIKLKAMKLVSTNYFNDILYIEKLMYKN